MERDNMLDGAGTTVFEKGPEPSPKARKAGTRTKKQSELGGVPTAPSASTDKPHLIDKIADGTVELKPVHSARVLAEQVSSVRAEMAKRGIKRPVASSDDGTSEFESYEGLLKLNFDVRRRFNVADAMSALKHVYQFFLRAETPEKTANRIAAQSMILSVRGLKWDTLVDGDWFTKLFLIPTIVEGLAAVNARTGIFEKYPALFSSYYILAWYWHGNLNGPTPVHYVQLRKPSPVPARVVPEFKCPVCGKIFDLDRDEKGSTIITQEGMYNWFILQLSEHGEADHAFKTLKVHKKELK